MKLKFNRNQIIVLGIAFLFIFYGLAQAVFKFELNKKITDEISFVLLIGAFILIFSGRKKNTSQTTTDDKGEEKTENRIEGGAVDKTVDITADSIADVTADSPVYETADSIADETTDN